jgi:hypothetical protein
VIQRQVQDHDWLSTLHLSRRVIQGNDVTCDIRVRVCAMIVMLDRLSCVMCPDAV